MTPVDLDAIAEALATQLKTGIDGGNVYPYEPETPALPAYCVGGAPNFPEAEAFGPWSGWLDWAIWVLVPRSDARSGQRTIRQAAAAVRTALHKFDLNGTGGGGEVKFARFEWHGSLQVGELSTYGAAVHFQIRAEDTP